MQRGLTRWSTGPAYGRPVTSNVGRQWNLNRTGQGFEMHAARNANTRCGSAMPLNLVANEADAGRAALRGPPRLGSRPPRLQASACAERHRAARRPIPAFPGTAFACAFHRELAGAPPHLNKCTCFATCRAARRKTRRGRRTPAGKTNFAFLRFCATVTLPPNPSLNRTSLSRLRRLRSAG